MKTLALVDTLSIRVRWLLLLLNIITSNELLLLDPLVHDLLAALRPQPHFLHFLEEVSEKGMGSGSGCFVDARFPLQKTIENDISCSNIIKFQESLAKIR